MRVTLEVFVFRCGRCAVEYREGWSTSEQYFVMRSEGLGSVAAIPQQGNGLLDELWSLVDRLSSVRELSPRKLGELKRTILSSVYDPDCDGSRFVVDGCPRCPACGWRTPSSFTASDPLEFVEVDLPDLTAESWAVLAPTAKERLVREAVSDALSQ